MSAIHRLIDEGLVYDAVVVALPLLLSKRKGRSLTIRREQFDKWLEANPDLVIKTEITPNAVTFALVDRP